MSQLIARQVMGRINMVSAMVAPTADIAGDLMQLASADRDKELARVAESRAELASAYGLEHTETRKPFAFASGVAIIPLHGSLINRFGQSYGYVTGYNFIRSQLALALADADVTAIVLDCNSYGGEVTGCFETADELFNARGKKPTLAVIDANCYSACYAIASAADRVVVTPTGGAGSIGAVAMHVSMEKMLAEFGYKVTLVYSGDHKVDGNPFTDLPDGVRADIQRGVDSTRAKFASMVDRNRGLDEGVALGTQAAVYRAEDALKIGLVDQVATPQEAVLTLLNELSGSPENLEKDMSKEDLAAPGATSQQAAAAAPNPEHLDAAALQKAERERCSAILGCEEAKGNSTLANHLAFNTQLSVDEAKGMLAASVPATAAAPVAATPAATAPAAATPNPFKEAMDADKQPNVGADGDGQPTAAAGGERAKEILANFRLASGSDLK